MTNDHAPEDPEQDRPIQDAHGGSMAPGLVDDTGQQITEVPDQADTEAEAPRDR